MAYSDFTLLEVQQKFGIRLEENVNLFATTPAAKLPPTLESLLERYLPLALNLNTEKARSELIIAPFLAEFKLLHHQKISVFSGIEFNVNDSLGLRGRCDYILSSNPQQLILTAPICVLVEAKNENIVGGIAQCLAEMIAAQEFNQKHSQAKNRIYGVVTTGTLWRFLCLENKTAQIDSIEYAIQNPEKIFGILETIAL
jgi:hypothetical protein